MLSGLWSGGHAAYLVGGGVRDALLGRAETDWDIATDARPERILELFPEGRYENRFGTVTVAGVEVTTFRRDHRYADHRRPDSVTFSDDLLEDLARRDFTVNAIAWGRAGDDGGAPEPGWVDPSGGFADLTARRLRAVGDPAARFDEDSLRLLRAARLAAQLEFEIEPATKAAMSETADLVRWVSTERVGAEVRRILAAQPPSAGFRILDDTGLLEPLFPELAAQRGVPQAKIPGHDVWQHSLATLDAAAAIDSANEALRLAALLHDIGKPRTYAADRFIGHDKEGALLAEALLARIAYARREIEPVVTLVRQHMFRYEPSWSNAAVRRFIRRVGTSLVYDLINLRQADNLGSGLAADADGSDQLRQRVAEQLARGVPLALSDLAVDGRDLLDELGLPPGPVIGRLLERLLDSVVADPERNRRELLLPDARAWAQEMKDE
jgi:tRNA nucleotidyltransferase (CCA-adding enzyme)